MANDIKTLEDKIDRLTRTLSELARIPPGLGPIIHKPGWTSIAESALFEAGIDGLQTHAEAMTEQCKRLTDAANKVGNEKSRSE
ncbi:hypothetical protein [Paraburkholderia sp. HD33-4]|uniref:hypothetical protein n=1 Tax=Paraburkholderia sp. HD33-4 TaxID=2883242 RepID=UPI001F2B2EB3|nr:hypothetical protein [Paraburkholderia sp. HD33-4]